MPSHINILASRFFFGGRGRTVCAAMGINSASTPSLSQVGLPDPRPKSPHLPANAHPPLRSPVPIRFLAR